MAKPRVFLSSTYYDLKHVRERIERFLVNFGMEPVLFENDNVTFEFNKPLDLSCYNCWWTVWKYRIRRKSFSRQKRAV